MNIERHWDAKAWEAEVTEDMNANITLVAAVGCGNERMMRARKTRTMEEKEGGAAGRLHLIYRRNIGGSGGMLEWKDNVGTKYWWLAEEGCGSGGRT